MHQGVDHIENQHSIEKNEVTANAYDLVRIAKISSGFSGTAYSMLTWDEKRLRIDKDTNDQYDAEFQHFLSEKAKGDAGTKATLMPQTKDVPALLDEFGTNLGECNSLEEKKCTDQAVGGKKQCLWAKESGKCMGRWDTKVSAIVDIAALFRDLKSDTVACLISRRLSSEKEFVAYYPQETLAVVLQNL
jgi:hypothetical protein